MSLAAALPAYKSDITTVFDNKENTPASSAADTGDFTLSWATTGIPMTMDTGAPPTKGLAPGQVVLLGVTSTPGNVTADGMGGIDSSSPGSGLSAAKSTLISDLTSMFSNTENTSDSAAQQFTDAVNSFFSQAKIMTAVIGIVPPGVPVPPPAGPVGPGSYTGTGMGGVDSSSPGAGLNSTVSTLHSDLEAIYTNIGNPPTPGNSPSEAAQAIADALEIFFLSAKIDTVNSGTASGGPAVVAVPPLPPNGSTLPPGSPASGNSSSGTIS